jgi:hypothetical protein
MSCTAAGYGSIDTPLNEKLLGIHSHVRSRNRLGVLALAVGIVMSAAIVVVSSKSSHRSPVNADEDLFTADTQPGQCVSQVFIIRHGEKENLIQTLTPLGDERAQYIASAFGSSLPSPSAIFARIPEPPKFVQREVLTVEPLAMKLNMTIRQYHRKDAVLMADKILSDIEKRQWCSQMVLVSWEHSDIEKLVRALGR